MKIDYDKVPHQYARCFRADCPKEATCLRRLVAEGPRYSCRSKIPEIVRGAQSQGSSGVLAGAFLPIFAQWTVGQSTFTSFSFLAIWEGPYPSMQRSAGQQLRLHRQ